MTKHLAIAAMGTNQPRCLETLSQQILDHDCNIKDARMTLLGNEFALIMLVNGRWDAIAKLETSLQKAATELGLTLTLKHTEKSSPAADHLPYQVHVIAVDKPGILQEICAFFTSQEVAIIDLHSERYSAVRTGVSMFKLEMSVDVPIAMQLAQLREQFMIFCDDRNIDAIVEPLRPHL